MQTISDRLLYFFMFVGRDDKCTKFLVHILKNNRELLINLCPTYMGLKKNSKEKYSNFDMNLNECKAVLDSIGGLIIVDNKGYIKFFYIL